MKPLLFFMCLLILSCNTGQTGKLDKSIVYSDTSSLFYKGAPLFVFNERFDKLSSRPIFFKDTTNIQGGGFSYITLDTFYTSRQSTGIIIGTLLIETNNLLQIERVRGYWAISVQMNDKTKLEAIETIQRKYFPRLAKGFLLTDADSVRHKSFVEEFKFYSSPDSVDVAHSFVPYWIFIYDAKPTKNGL